jgi:hypothetical protein
LKSEKQNFLQGSKEYRNAKKMRNTDWLTKECLGRNLILNKLPLNRSRVKLEYHWWKWRLRDIPALVLRYSWIEKVLEWVQRYALIASTADLSRQGWASETLKFEHSRTRTASWTAETAHTLWRGSPRRFWALVSKSLPFEAPWVRVCLRMHT